MNRIAPRLIFALALAAVLAPSVVFAQLPTVAQQHLAAATTALNSIDSKAVSVEAGNRVASVRRDFQEMQAALPNPAGSAETDWRTKYSAVERDLTGLIGPMNAQPGETASASNLPPLDAATRGALQQFRSSIELFYAATMGQPMQPSEAAAANPTGTPTMPNPATGTNGAPATTATAGGTTGTSIPGEAGAAPTASSSGRQSIDAEGAAALLDRMETILNAALGEKSADSGKAVGTSGVGSKSKAGKLAIDRSALDEILAEVQQLKTMLRVKQ